MRILLGALRCSISQICTELDVTAKLPKESHLVFEFSGGIVAQRISPRNSTTECSLDRSLLNIILM